MIKNLTTLIGVAATSLLITSTASAQVVINSSDLGWYTDTGVHDTDNHNYFTGLLLESEYRSFFHFDLGSVSGSLLSAELRIYNPTTDIGGFVGSDASESITLFDVSTSTSSLLDGSAGIAAFNDLGSGLSLGSAIITPASNGTFTVINLNASGITLLQAALGSNISFGAALNSIVGLDDQGVFGFSDFDLVAGNAQLGLTLDQGQFTPVPETSTYGLIGAAGLIGIVVLRRRRNAAK